MRGAEGPRAADGGAPPWHGATLTVRVRSKVSEVRRQTKTSDPIMAARPHSAAEFSRIREQGLVVVLQRTVLGSGAASGLIQTVALPQVSLQTGAQFVPSGFPLGWCGEPLASERPDLRLGPGSRSPAPSPRAGSAPGGSRSRLRPRPLVLPLVTGSLGSKESPQESRSAPRDSAGLAGCAGEAGPWARPHSSLSARWLL